MLTDADIAYMYETSNEIKAKRMRDVTLIYDEGREDEFTGEIIDTVSVERNIRAVVTEMSSSTSAGADRYMANGIKYESGDIWLSVAVDDVEDIADKVTRMRYSEKEYTILAMDKKGIGRRNRYEVLGRVTA